MMIHDITEQAGKYKARKRVGRGLGSGRGKRATRGQKGAGSRSGNSAKKAFEGGQMPYFRRLVKYGFNNANFRVEFWTVNLREILDHPSFASGGVIDQDSLIKAGLIRDTSRNLKILGDIGDREVKAKFEINAHRVTASVRKIVTDAGGSVNEIGTRRDRIRGVDRNAGDPTPTNLTKKLKKYKNRQKTLDEIRAKSGSRAKLEAKGKSEGKGKGKPSKKSKADG